MCLSKTPKIEQAPQQQEVKQPDSTNLRTNAQQNRSGMAGGSLLTGPSGIAQGGLNTSRATLLGQ